MTFDVKAFKRAKLQPRTEEVPVPGLSAFFKEGETATWKVRGLSATEYAKADDAGRRAKDLVTHIKGLTREQEKVEELRNALGLGDAVPAEISKRMEMLVVGSVQPTCDLDTAIKLAQYFPIEFYQLTNHITRLTGAGAEVGKSQPSGKEKMSKQV